MGEIRVSDGKAASTVKVALALPRNGPLYKQHHRGFYGYVYKSEVGVKGYETIKCGHFHQKRGAAIKCANRLAKRVLREAQS